MILILPIATLSVATLLAGAALVMAFFRRMPAVLPAYAAMVVAQMSDMIIFTSGTLWFWGAAAAIALAIQYMVRPTASRTRQLYTVGASLAGAVIGLAVGTRAAVIIAAAAGAFLGYAAYGRTPAGRMSARPHGSADDMAATALPAVVNFSMLMLIFAQLIQA